MQPRGKKMTRSHAMPGRVCRRREQEGGLGGCSVTGRVANGTLNVVVLGEFPVQIKAKSAFGPVFWGQRRLPVASGQVVATPASVIDMPGEERDGWLDWKAIKRESAPDIK